MSRDRWARDHFSAVPEDERLMRLAGALLITLTVACGPQPAGPTPAATSPLTPPAATATAGESPVSSPGGPPPLPSAAVAGLQTSALGPLRGDWVFAVRETYVPPAVGVRVDIVALPIDGSGPAGQPPRVAASYVKAAGGVTLPPPEVLPRQFSSDGRRLALSIPDGVVVVSLETGGASLVAPGGRSPVWGAGERIAFHRVDPSAALSTPATGWIVPASSGTPTEHRCGSAIAWTHDGSACIRGATGGIVLEDSDASPGTGWPVRFDVVSTGELPLGVRPQPGPTVLAVASTDVPPGPAVPGQRSAEDPHEHRIEILRAAGASHDVVAREAGHYTEIRFAEPRWNPRAEQILYRISGSRRLETHVVDLGTKQDVVARITGVARAAEWTPNGEQIVYLTDPHTPIGRATEVRAVRPLSGRDDRVLMAAAADAQVGFTSVVARGYPVPAAASIPPTDASRALAMSNAPRAVADPQSAARAARAIDAFAAEMYGELSQKPGNLVFSPYSIVAALAMTRAGASGETARQMDAVLHADVAGDLDTAMNALDRALAQRPGTDPFGQGTVPLELATANQLWGQRGAEFGREFLDVLATQYGAGMRLVDYVHAHKDARDTINAWVSDQTRARIPELIPEDALSPLTRLVLTNAIYLKAKWERAFSEARPAPFHRLDGTVAEVPLMRRAASAGYGRGSGYQTVQLRYVGGLSMLVIVPDAGSFGPFEARLRDPARLAEVTSNIATTHVNLGLPRFEIRTGVALNAALARLGMPIAFTERADFSKMSPREPLLIQAVAHEGWIAVDEEGTEAAAATAVIGGATGGPSQWVDLTVDRPFLFLIRDDETGAVLFMGRVVEPE